MPVKSTDEAHDNVAYQIEPYFIKRMLLDVHREHKLFRQLIQTMATQFGELLTRLNGQPDSQTQVNQTIQLVETKLQTVLTSYAMAIPSHQLDTYQAINHELVKAVGYWMADYNWAHKIDYPLVTDMLSYSHGQMDSLDIHIVYQELEHYVAAWQLQVLNMCEHDAFQCIPFVVNMNNPDVTTVDLYEIGLTNLSNQHFLQYIDNHCNAQLMDQNCHAYQILQHCKEDDMSEIERQVLQNVFIYTKAGINPTQLDVNDRKTMYYKDIN